MSDQAFVSPAIENAAKEADFRCKDFIVVMNMLNDGEDISDFYPLLTAHIMECPECKRMGTRPIMQRNRLD